jgi:hypothetical protein
VLPALASFRACQQRPLVIESLDPLQPGTLRCDASVGPLPLAAISVCGQAQLTLQNLVLEGCPDLALVQGTNASIVLRNVQVIGGVASGDSASDAYYYEDALYDYAAYYEYYVDSVGMSVMRPAVMCRGCRLSVVNVTAAGMVVKGPDALINAVDSVVYCTRSKFIAVAGAG